MIENWAEVVADRIVGRHPFRQGKLLLLGAIDTGKTTLLGALVNRLARRRPVAVVDADIGQSHIGPPATVGWTVVEESGGRAVPTDPERPLERVNSARPARGTPPGGIAFVGDVTPLGHLLQLTAALALCVEQAQRAAAVVLIDTPGLVEGGAACELWWTVQRWLRPERIVAVQRQDELRELLGGLQAGLSEIEIVETPAQLRRKSPEARQAHRRRLFEEYFREAAAWALSLRHLAVRSAQRITPDNVAGRLAGLSDDAGQDLAVGVIERWQPRRARMTIRTPQLDTDRVRCLTIGNVRMDAPLGWSG